MQKRTLLNIDNTMNIDGDELVFEETNDFLKSLIEKYEKRYQSKVIGALFTGEFISRYDNIFSGRGGIFIPTQGLTIENVLSKFEFDVAKIYIDSTGHVNFELLNHDGTTKFVLTLITESFSQRKHFQSLLYDEDGRVTAKLVKTVFGKLDLTGTKVFK